MSDPAADRADSRGDPFAETAGAYVIGALDVEERVAFEAHLAVCAACREAVDDVVHLPELLRAVPPDGPVDPPPSVLSALLAVIARDEVGEHRSVRRRRALAAGGLVGAAAAGFLAGALVLPRDGVGGPVDDGAAVGADGAGTAGPGTSAPGVVLTTTADVPVSASVALEPASWGTRLLVTCTYDSGPSAASDPYAVVRPFEYALVVRGADGVGQQVATWLAGPGDAVTVPAATALTVDEITGLEMTLGGEVVLSADV